jgi:hypothetical protein
VRPGWEQRESNSLSGKNLRREFRRRGRSQRVVRGDPQPIARGAHEGNELEDKRLGPAGLEGRETEDSGLSDKATAR